jgi:hypothetical protein
MKGENVTKPPGLDTWLDRCICDHKEDRPFSLTASVA